MKENIDLSISQDSMLATLVVLPPIDGQEDVTFEEIEDAICEAGIMHGVNNGVIQQLQKEIECNRIYEIANGTLPKTGIDGKVVYEFNTDKLIKPSLLDDGSVDFHNLNIVNNVSRGEVIVRLKPEIEGEDGQNVLGEIVPAPPVKKALLPKHGPNIRTISGGKELISEIDGHVDLIYDKVVVNEVMTISGSIDHNTGDLNYNGSIMISGNVLSGFSIKAQKNIEVMGIVEGATLLAGGNIIIRGGIQGMDKARLICNGTLAAKYVNNAFVKANGNITTNSILHSEVSCNDVINVQGKGLISGGKVRANKLIDAKTIGTHLGTKSFIEVGVDPDIVEKFHEFKEKKQTSLQEKKKIEQIINVLEDRKAKGVISPERLAVLQKSYKTQKQLIKDITAADQIVKQLQPLIENVRGGKVKVSQILYPGVVVTIGSQSLRVRNKIDRCTLVLDAGEVRTAPY